jgi:hypothetical protein
MRMLLTLIPILLTWGGSEAWAWGRLGHEAVAEAVQDALNPRARQAIAGIFGQDGPLEPGTLARASIWPDQVRDVAKGKTRQSGLRGRDLAEAKMFIKHHPKTAEWHYVNLPLGVDSYPDRLPSDPQDPLHAFVHERDIVQILRTCIRILEGAAPESGWTRAQALRWLIHLAQDIHQPLHVATGYYRTTPKGLPQPPLIINPVEAGQPGVIHDRGGSDLLFTSRPTNNLHAVWDDCLVDRAADLSCREQPTARDTERLAKKLKTRLKNERDAGQWKSTGDHRSWPVQWASDSLRVAAVNRLYHFSVQEGPLIKESAKYHPTLVIVPPPCKGQYVATHRQLAEMQLFKAAVRLADLLNQLNWPS